MTQATDYHIVKNIHLFQKNRELFTDYLFELIKRTIVDKNEI